MPATLQNILGRDGAVARRLGERYEFRPQQLEMAAAGSRNARSRMGHHLLVEAGTGVGKSFAYLLPAIDYAVRTKKRVVISTHTISLQEQLIEKDIPLLQAVYPDEFTAVLVKGRSNYLCRRRLGQTRSRQQMLFDHNRQLESLWAIEEWANETNDGSLADLPNVPDPSVWDRVCAEHGNCLGKKCQFYNNCFWQSAKRRMGSGNILVVNHALFFSDLALRMAGVNYLPKYDAVILDEAHTVEDVAGSHFGLKVSESGLREVSASRCCMTHLPRQRECSAPTAAAKPIRRDSRTSSICIKICSTISSRDACNGSIIPAGPMGGSISRTLSRTRCRPKVRELSLHLKAMLATLAKEEEVSEISSAADKVALLGQTLEAVVSQSMPDAVYWMDQPGKSDQRKVTLNAAPVNIAEGLKRHLFSEVKSVVMTSATLCTNSSSSATKRLPPFVARAARPCLLPATDASQTIRPANPPGCVPSALDQRRRHLCGHIPSCRFTSRANAPKLASRARRNCGKRAPKEDGPSAQPNS